ncbi:ABC transporter substrate-binding protein [Salipaludibacillus sp. HK11]|uniref:ABC transporter substrate-binding protein n=1 Tax=Salipaludibacillus sp. HK11 TaxID=3394320 RepID=UPI0039FC18E9
MIKRLAVITVLLVVVGCSNNDSESGEQNERNDSQKLEDAVLDELDERTKIQLDVWAYYEEGWEYPIEEYQSLNPDITLNVTTFTHDTYVNEYLKALVDNDVPDVMIFENNQFATFTAVDGLENLAGEPYTLNEYYNDFSRTLWDMGLSIDNEELIGLAYDSYPYVTYYRADIMEEYGFPSDPDELGTFMEDADNWLNMAGKLKEDHKWIVGWDVEILNIFDTTRGIFNQDLEFNRKDQLSQEAIRILQAVHERGLDSKMNIWDEQGLQALKNDEIVMLQLGSWGSGLLYDMVPEQAGKWRVTRLPFNQYGLGHTSIISIPSASEKKEAAADFLEYFVFEREKEGSIGPISGYLPHRNDPKTINHENEFLGGQQDQRKYEQIYDKIEEPKLTPLDEKANQIWYEMIYTGLEEDQEIEEILDSIEKKIQEQLGSEIDRLK